MHTYNKIEVEEMKTEDRTLKGYPMFNDCSHTLIDLSGLREEDNDWMHTLSVKLPDGKFVTMCVMRPDDEHSCVDLRVHGDGEHRVEGFEGGVSESVDNKGLYSLIMNDVEEGDS